MFLFTDMTRHARVSDVFHEGVWHHSNFVSRGGMLKNATHTSPGNSVEYNKSDDAFKTPEVFPILYYICIRRSASGLQA